MNKATFKRMTMVCIADAVANPRLVKCYQNSGMFYKALKDENLMAHYILAMKTTGGFFAAKECEDGKIRCFAHSRDEEGPYTIFLILPNIKGLKDDPGNVIVHGLIPDRAVSKGVK